MIELNVRGMTCGHCADAVSRAIRAVDPQARVRIDVAAGEAGYPAAPSGGATSQAPAKPCCCG